MSAKSILVALVALAGAGATDGDTSAGAVATEVEAVRPAAARALHFALSRSVPEADAETAPPPAVRLWFTEVPQENSMSVRLLDGAGEPVETGALAQDPEDGRIFSLPIQGTLPAAAYTVSWRAIGQDGHVVRGDFGFTVTAE